MYVCVYVNVHWIRQSMSVERHNEADAPLFHTPVNKVSIIYKANRSCPWHNTINSVGKRR